MSDPRYTDPRYSDPNRPTNGGPPRPLDVEARRSSGAMWTGVIVVIIAIVVVLGLAVGYNNRTEQAGNQPNTQPTTTGSAPAQPRPATPSNSGDVSQPPAPAQPPSSSPPQQTPAPTQPPR